MTAPNMALITTITGRTAVMNVSTVTANIISNAANSNTVQKINTLLVTNVSSGNTVDVSVSVFRNAYDYRVANTISISPKTSLIAIGKDAPIYLEEGDSLRLTASANSAAEAIISYEIIG